MEKNIEEIINVSDYLYKNKLVELGVMKNLKNSFSSNFNLHSTSKKLCRK